VQTLLISTLWHAIVLSRNYGDICATVTKKPHLIGIRMELYRPSLKCVDLRFFSALIFEFTFGMVCAMKSHRDIIDLWPPIGSRSGLQVFADDIGVPYGTAQVMRFRGWVHARHWLAMSRAAQKRGLKDVTVAFLAEVSSQRSKKKSIASRGEHRVA
jgi:hypothetical protein